MPPAKTGYQTDTYLHYSVTVNSRFTRSFHHEMFYSVISSEGITSNEQL